MVIILVNISLYPSYSFIITYFATLYSPIFEFLSMQEL